MVDEARQLEEIEGKERMQRALQEVGRWRSTRKERSDEDNQAQFGQLAQSFNNSGVPLEGLTKGLKPEELEALSGGDMNTLLTENEKAVQAEMNSLMYEMYSIVNTSADGINLDPQAEAAMNQIYSKAQSKHSDNPGLIQGLRNMMRPWLPEWQETQAAMVAQAAAGDVPQGDAPVKSSIRPLEERGLE